jgi:hypothetical protein
LALQSHAGFDEATHAQHIQHNKTPRCRQAANRSEISIIDVTTIVMYITLIYRMLIKQLNSGQFEVGQFSS